MHNDHKLPGRHQLYSFFWGRHKTTRYFYQARLIIALLFVQFYGDSFENLSRKEQIPASSFSSQFKEDFLGESEKNLFILQQKKKLIILKNKTSRCSEEMVNSECPSVVQKVFLWVGLRPGVQLGGCPAIVPMLWTEEKLNSSKRRSHSPGKTFIAIAYEEKQ